MVKKDKVPVYKMIFYDIKRHIDHGFYAPGDVLPSQNVLCKRYSISLMTAVKVHNELERSGIAYKVRGRGIYVSSESKELERTNAATVCRGVVLHSCVEEIDCGYHYLRMLDGVRRRAFELGLNVRTEHFSHTRRGSLHMDDDEVLLVPYVTNCEWVFQLGEYRLLKSVMINNVYPAAHSVIVDNWHGMAMLLDYLERRKCRKIFLCAGHYSDLGLGNLSERTHAFEVETERRKLDSLVLSSGNMKEIFELCRDAESAPDAVMFVSDDPAIKFKKMLEDNAVKRFPLVTGFDWFPGMPRDMATYHADYEGLGARAVDLAHHNTLEDWLLPRTSYVRGKIALPDF